MADRRRTYAPVLASGVLSATLVATLAGRTLLDVDGADAVAVTSLGAGDRGSLPLAMALSLVVLACWGVVLVTRRWIRAGAAVLGALAAGGVLVTVVAGWWVLSDGLREDFSALGVDVVTHTTPSYWVTLLGALVSAAASVSAVVLLRWWPAMGSRYDRPSEDGETGPVAVEDDDLALWKALDEGRDPTAEDAV